METIIYNVTAIKYGKAKKYTAGCKPFYTRDITVIDGKGHKVTLILFSDDPKTLKIVKE